MILSRHLQAAKIGLSVLFSLLLCWQSLVPLSVGYAHASNSRIERHETIQSDTLHQTTLFAGNDEKKSDSSDSVPTQPSHESESELEEKSEKELEDDNEELDNALDTFQVLRAKYYQSSDMVGKGAISDVPTPPPNR